MSDNTIRIRTTPNGGDKYVKIKIDQDFDFVQILSLSISQQDAYVKFCSDYGVIVGRVVINNGFGIPNAKVSVFIPLSSTDAQNPDITGLYPYETVTDTDSDGIRYNLLPDSNDSQNECYTPVGTFKNKRQVLDNNSELQVYCQYYQYTTTTNNSGDFMIFGVPLGTYTVHVDVDISDIGIASQRPYDLISQGTPPNFFDSPTKFKSGTNLDTLVQIKTFNAGVNVQPFWGDATNCEIGISRLDFNLNYNLTPSAIFMGSIFGDQDKDSVNKHCRPRDKLGEICQQVAGTGSVNMIRQTIDGQIESFDVNGGRVVDDNGTWAYQIPMNLDYMVTDETGNLVLSNDPNIGIPTRASVRFKIGMDETGDEGRLRTRASYLVPNNPANPSEIDYEFGHNTLSTSFRNIYWNKIYSISNYITRFQRITATVPVSVLYGNVGPTRATTAIKNVDGCPNSATPFPYNKVNVNSSGIFTIICLLMYIIGTLLVILNGLIITTLNAIIYLLNFIFQEILDIFLRGVSKAIKIITFGKVNLNLTIPCIPSIPCVSINCPQEDGVEYAPGCIPVSPQCGSSLDTNANTNLTDMINCIAFELAQALNMFQFDFYNDWVNGSLFGFLLKYKKKVKGKELFCEYDCADFVGAADYTGVDNAQNGTPDNNCYPNNLVDTCYTDTSLLASATDDYEYAYTNVNPILEGLIKKVDGDFYYAASTHGTNGSPFFKLFATEIINLGSVFQCDWQGIPNIQPFLIPTSYKIPPPTDELNDSGQVETTGMLNPDSNNGSPTGLFFTIDCSGLHVSQQQCLNIRHLCEFGVNLDEYNDDTGQVPQGFIGANDIDQTNAKFVRDAFYGLNVNGPDVLHYIQAPAPNGFATNFNTNNHSIYDWTSPSDNGIDYITFKGYTSSSFKSYTNTNNSYFLYFGLIPGQTALERMNANFFTTCVQSGQENIIIQTTTTNITGLPTNTNGSITFTFIGGTAPYTYTIVGIDGTSYQYPLVGTSSTNSMGLINNLSAGVYLISGVDSLGNPVSKTVVISPPPLLNCSVIVTQNSSSTAAPNGQITIVSVIGGLQPYIYTLVNGVNAYITGGTISTQPLYINGLSPDNVGYTLTISDNSSPIQTCITTGLTVSGPVALNASVSMTPVTCYGGANGAMSINVIGGQPPYTILVTGPNGFVNNSLNSTGLVAGVYNISVIDSLGTTASISPSSSITIPTTNQQINLVSGSATQLATQCSPTNTTIPLYITTGVAIGDAITVNYSIDGGATNTYITTNTTPINLVVNQPITDYIDIYVGNSMPCYSNTITISQTSIKLPSAVLSINENGIDNSEQCDSSTTTVSFNIVGGLGAPYTITYSVNSNITTVTTSSTQPIFTTTGTGTITVTVADSVGCTATYQITDAIRPATNLNGTVTNTHGQGNLNVTPTGGLSPYTYLWSNGATSQSQTVPYVSGAFYSVTITDSVGCSKTLNYNLN